MIKILIARLTPEGEKFEGVESKTIINIENNESISLLDDIEYSVTGFLVNNGVLVEGSVNTAFNAVCDRCLKRYKLPVSINDICHFYEKPDKYYIDLTEDISEDILIALPQKNVCSETCRGICFNCGKNLNTEACNCNNEVEKTSIWADLNTIKL